MEILNDKLIKAFSDDGICMSRLSFQAVLMEVSAFGQLKIEHPNTGTCQKCLFLSSSLK